MRISTSAILAAVAAPLLAFAQTNSTGADNNGPNAFKIPPEGLMSSAGKTTNLQWTPTTDGTVTLILRSGASNNLNEGAVIASSIPNSGSYEWKVPSDITRGSDYAVEIVSDSNENDVNYTNQFVIDSPNTVATSTGEVTMGVLTPTPVSTSGGSSNSASATKSASMTGSSASSGSTAAATDSSSASMTGSMTGSMSSGSMTMTGSSSMTTMTSSGSSSGAASSATQSDLQASSSSEGVGARATAMVGMLGAVALGALAL